MSSAQTELDAELAAAVPALASAAAAVIGIDGEPVARAGVGELIRYADEQGTLAVDRPAADLATRYDLASLTKLYTTVATLILTERDGLDLTRPIRHWLPDYVDDRIDLERLLTHTAGLPAGVQLRGTDSGTRRGLVMGTGPQDEPGTGHRYSDVSFILTGWVLEAHTGTGLDDLIAELITIPLGLTDTEFRPLRRLGVPRDIAATEYKDGRLRHGVVHDETAKLLGEVAGHAGLFATVTDLWRFAEALRTNALLSPETTERMIRPRIAADGFAQGFGVRVGDPAITGKLTGSYGHTGFTGTSLVVDPARATTVVLTTNRVHPVRTRSQVNPVRCAIADIAYREQRRKHAGTSPGTVALRFPTQGRRVHGPLRRCARR
ncbi:serine hydrolase domain-containing protein [Stackebrandtia endophytica]|uniref:serine hydrolase domain-containing protein n=1 Tax=Stackebrandtia endophytica TaxID=1496996 RepID=UPI00114D5E5F|nr:serine hydrolase domain-containing protein [Stackebrandtia endophytica]